MKQRKHYWKVVRLEDDGKMRSVSISEGKYCVEYKIGERIKAPINGLFVFETRKQARNFKGRYLNNRIFKVKVFGEEIINPTFFKISYLNYEEIVIGDGSSLFTFPEGTHAFPEVELIKEQ